MSTGNQDKYKVLSGKYLKSNRGEVSMSLIVVIGMVCLIFVLVLSEWFRDMVLFKPKVEASLNGAAKIAIAESMLNEYRRDRISKIDKDRAHSLFFKHLKEELELNDNLEHTGTGPYKLVIKEFTIVDEPPAIRVKAEILADPIIFKSLINEKVTIPVSGSSRNKRIALDD